MSLEQFPVTMTCEQARKLTQEILSIQKEVMQFTEQRLNTLVYEIEALEQENILLKAKYPTKLKSSPKGAQNVLDEIMGELS